MDCREARRRKNRLGADELAVLDAVASTSYLTTSQ